MEYAVPILILSANNSPYSERRQGCRETWVPLLRTDFHPLFVLGSPDLKEDWRFEGDVLRVRCHDDYLHLCEKMRLALAAVLDRFAFPWLFKCDDDTWLNAWRFNGYPFWNWDQVGAFAWGENGWASGAGYSLSYRAARYVLTHWLENEEITTAEDRHIGGLVRKLPGAKRFHEPAIQCASGPEWRPCLLGHWIKTPDEMHAFHLKALQHEQETGTLLGGYNLAGGFAQRPAETRQGRTKPKPSADARTNGQIFVQIAAYRDPDLIATLRDLVGKSSDPRRLRVGLCWQRSPEDSLEEFADDPRIRVRDVPWQQAKGLCWARRRTQELHVDEEFTFQIDAHERFVDGWDDLLIRMLLETDAAKPILTSYPEHFVPGAELAPGVPYQIQTTHFRENGTLNQFPYPMGNFEALAHPVPARFVAGGFLFTRGAHCHEVPYDPMIYFGDEISMAVRSYTHGYDLFHPHQHIAWHYYVRQAAVHHWDDHSESSRKDGISEHFWWLREWRSQLQHEQLFGMADHRIREIPGFGRERTLTDYERFAGIDFRNRKIHRATLAGIPPPVPSQDDLDWRLGLRRVVVQ
jgi:hypothetical protein